MGRGMVWLVLLVNGNFPSMHQLHWQARFHWQTRFLRDVRPYAAAILEASG